VNKIPYSRFENSGNKTKINSKKNNVTAIPTSTTSRDYNKIQHRVSSTIAKFGKEKRITITGGIISTSNESIPREKSKCMVS